MKYIKKVPLAISSISLAFAALGNLLLSYGESIRYICGIFSGFIFCIFILKLLLDFQNVKEEIKNPIVLSILPTATMSLMLLCTYIKPFIGSIAIILWFIALIIHISIMILFFRKFILHFNIKNVFPSWFVVCVGIVTASITSPAMNTKPLGRIIFFIGFILYFIIFPVIVYRIIKLKSLPEPVQPTIAIFTAPMSLCIAGYISSFDQYNNFLIYIMLSIAVVSYIYVCINMVFLLRLKFYPTYAAFTFPYVISAIAFKSANIFLINNGYSFFSPLQKISELLAVIIVIYVSIRYAIFLLKTS